MSVLDIGNKKQLFLDERLVEESEGVTLNLNRLQPTGTALIRPDSSQEEAGGGYIGSYSSVMKEDGKIRIWYFLNQQDMYKRRICYAESEDGIHFTKPKFEICETESGSENNAIIADPIQGACVWRDPQAPPDKRYRTQAKWGPFPGKKAKLHFYASPDGIRWEETHAVDIGACDTQNVVFWDERYQTYVMYTRHWSRFDDPNLNHRKVRRLESTDLVDWDNESIVWEADAEDLSLFETSTGMPPVDYYGACVYRYPGADSLYILLSQPFWHWKDRPEEEKWGFNPKPESEKRAIHLAPATIDLRLGYSLDGKRFERTSDRGPFLATGPDGRFDSRMVWAMPNPIDMGDEIWIYYVGGNRDHDGFVDPSAPERKSGIGRAVMRKDGFVSADADYTGGWLVTPPLTFDGDTLKLNLEACGGGSVRVELLDEGGELLGGFTADEAEYVFGNSCEKTVRWKERSLGELAGRPVRFKFHMQDARLYSFQVV